MKKIAPWWQAWMRTDASPYHPGLPELRALLAVATVAKRVGREWEAWDEARPETCAALYRALARLDALPRKGAK